MFKNLILYQKSYSLSKIFFDLFLWCRCSDLCVISANRQMEPCLHTSREKLDRSWRIQLPSHLPGGGETRPEVRHLYIFFSCCLIQTFRNPKLIRNIEFFDSTHFLCLFSSFTNFSPRPSWIKMDRQIHDTVHNIQSDIGVLWQFNVICTGTYVNDLWTSEELESVGLFFFNFMTRFFAGIIFGLRKFLKFYPKFVLFQLKHIINMYQ